MESTLDWSDVSRIVDQNLRDTSLCGNFLERGFHGSLARDIECETEDFGTGV